MIITEAGRVDDKRMGKSLLRWYKVSVERRNRF